MARKFAFFPHQKSRSFSINNETDGDFPDVRVYVHNSDGVLQREVVPTSYLGDDHAVTVVVDLGDGGKSGFIVIAP